jgi:hypothetical protein
MAAAAAGGGSFQIERVVRRTFGAIGANFGVFAALTLIVAGVPSAVGVSAAYADGRYHLLGFLGGGWPLGALLGVVVAIGAIAIYFMLQASIIYGVVAYLNDRKATFGECLAKGAAQWFPLLLMAIVVGLAEIVGFLLFIAPGIMLAMAWCVAVPVRVVEGRDVIDSLSRSADLTRGRRWPIFGLVLIYEIANTIIKIVLQGLIAAFASTPGSQVLFWGSPILSFVLSFVAFVIVSAGVGAIYYELRSTREGIGVAALAAVFD